MEGVVRTPCENVVKLNVGGTRFWTTRETLLSSDSSYFSSLLGGAYSNVVDDEGSVFIDRDPLAFRVVLNYLRTGRVALGDVCAETIFDEATFFGIASLAERVEPLLPADHGTGGLFYSGSITPLEIEPSAPDSPSAFQLLSGSRSSSPPPLSPPSPAHFSRAQPIPEQRARLLVSDHNWLVVAYERRFYCFSHADSNGWSVRFASPALATRIDHVAIAGRGGAKIVVVAAGSVVRLWSCGDGVAHPRWHSGFDLGRRVDKVFFIGSCVAALSYEGRVGVWNSMSSKNWQVQDVQPISSHVCAGSLLFLGFASGRISYIDMDKFPLRLKDDSLLVNDFYDDPHGDQITSLSVFLTSASPGASMPDNCIELAYGTAGGLVRVVLLHPDTLGQRPQLFQTFSVHAAPVAAVQLTEHALISVSLAGAHHHARTWRVTRFRGRISTQPGAIPIGSFRLLPWAPPPTTDAGHFHPPVTDHQIAPSRALPMSEYPVGPFGDKNDRQLLLQRVPHEAARLQVLDATSGRQVCAVATVGEKVITAAAVCDLDYPKRLGSRGKCVLATGLEDGTVQMWDLTTALEMFEAKGAARADTLRVSRRATHDVEISDIVM